MVRFYQGGGFIGTPAAVPELPGIYMLRHDNSDTVYIGMSKNLRLRFSNWSLAIQNNGRKVNAVLMRDAIRSLDKRGWSFIVLNSKAGLTREELSKYERHAIRGVLDRGTKLYNATLDKPKTYRPSYSQLKRERLGQSIMKVTDSEP